MFPDAVLYYGLDISKTRLASSVNKKHSSDILLLADLTQSFECRNFFDAVVSLNTLSHLTPDLQTIAYFQILFNYVSQVARFLSILICLFII